MRSFIVSNTKDLEQSVSLSASHMVTKRVAKEDIFVFLIHTDVLVPQDFKEYHAVMVFFEFFGFN